MNELYIPHEIDPKEYDEVYSEGVKAFHDGKLFTENPYIIDPPLYHWYGEGWLAAYDLSKKVKNVD